MSLAPKPGFVVVEMEVAGKYFNSGLPFSFKVEYYQPATLDKWIEWIDKETHKKLLDERLRIRLGDRCRGLHAGTQKRASVKVSEIVDYAADFHPAVKATIKAAPRPMTMEEHTAHLATLPKEERQAYIAGLTKMVEELDAE